MSGRHDTVATRNSSSLYTTGGRQLYAHCIGHAVASLLRQQFALESGRRRGHNMTLVITKQVACEVQPWPTVTVTYSDGNCTVYEQLFR
jgi:hypothetical protein